MSKKSKASKKSKSKQKKKALHIEYEYKGDITNFEEFANFYRQRDAILKSIEKKDLKTDKNCLSSQKLLNPNAISMYDRSQQNLSLMKCENEYNSYYSKLLELSKQEKSPLDVLSELAYLDFYKEKSYIENDSKPRNCVLGHQNCTKKECWMENCKHCIKESCSSCTSDRLTKVKEYFNNTEVERKESQSPQK